MNKLVIVKVAHIDYNLVANKPTYYFQTYDVVRVGDKVYCDTINGLMVGEIKEIYTEIEEIINLKDLPLLKNIKYCRINLESELPF